MPKGSHLPSLFPVRADVLSKRLRLPILRRYDQTKEATAERLHDGMQDTFVCRETERLPALAQLAAYGPAISIADTLVQSIRLRANGSIRLELIFPQNAGLSCSCVR